MFQNDAPIRTLELFGHKPKTDNISWKQYEQLLKMTHEAILHHKKRDKITQKLVPYSGPQCNEDRGNKARVPYNSDLRRRITAPDMHTPSTERACRRSIASSRVGASKSWYSQSVLGKIGGRLDRWWLKLVEA